MTQQRNQDEDIAIVRLGEGPALREDDIDGWHRLEVACAAVDAAVDEDGQDVPERRRRAELMRSTPANGRVLRWAARDARGETVGSARLYLPDTDGVEHLSLIRIAVHPERRRRGIAGRLLAAVGAEARAAGRSSLTVTARAGSAAEQALTAWGFAPGAPLVRLRLDVAGCDREALRSTVQAASEGYELARWQGVVPKDLAGAYARARNAMGDVPGQDMDWARAPWDEARLRSFAETHAGKGDALLTVAALYLDERGDEAVAGFSEILLSGGTGPLARQSDTAVVRSHRGRGLGLWVKAAMLQWLLGAHPEVRTVMTHCAEENHHMIAINERLGFAEAGRSREFRLSLD